jgi:hypothetical protein
MWCFLMCHLLHFLLRLVFNVQWVSKIRRGDVFVTYCGLEKIVLNVDSLCLIVIRVNQDKLTTLQWMYGGV